YEEEDDQWQLAGRLRRNDETLNLSDTVLLVPGGYVVTTDRIARLKDSGVFDWVSLLRRPEPLAIPAGEEQEFVDRLLDMPALPRLELPPELRLEEVVCDPAPQLIIRTPRGARWHKERLQGEVIFDYLGATIRSASPQGAIVQREQGRCIVRNRALE